MISPPPPIRFDYLSRWEKPNRTFCRGGMTKPKHSGIHLNAKIPPTQMKTVKNAWLGDEVLSKVIGETQKLSKEKTNRVHRIGIHGGRISIFDPGDIIVIGCRYTTGCTRHVKCHLSPHTLQSLTKDRFS